MSIKLKFILLIQQQLVTIKILILIWKKNDPVDAIICADYVRVGRCKNLNHYRGYQKNCQTRATR